MIVGTLKNNTQQSIILILIITLVLWATKMIVSNSMVLIPVASENSLLPLTYLNQKLSFSIQHIISLLTILIGSFLLNYLCIDQEITSKSNFLPSFIYILFSFSINSNNIINSIFIANIFLLVAFYFFSNSYRVDKALAQLFNAGLSIGLTCFFCMNYFPLLFLGYIALIILRPFNGKETIAYTVGLLAPAYVYLSIAYLYDKSMLSLFDMIANTFQTISSPNLSEFYIGLVIISMLLLIGGLIYYITKGFGAKVKTQKIKHILCWLIAFTSITSLFEKNSDNLLLLNFIPLSIISGDYLAEIKQLKIANTLLVLLIASFSIMFLHVLNFI